MKLAIVLFNLGGPDSLEAVEPFLRNMFRDPAIISLPGILRVPLARLIAGRRGPIAREIYSKIGGRSPIVPETEAQARALEQAVRGHAVKAFIAMRYWKPFSDEAAAMVAAWSPDHIVLLPLYPQFSTTTTESSLRAWQRAAKAAGITAPTSTVCCYPTEPGFIAGAVAQIRETMTKCRPDLSYRLLLSAHGLPKRVIERGDPYQAQVEQTAAAIVRELGMTDWTVCYQSRVGPLEWIGPATDAEIRRAGTESRAVVIAPIAFVSEHSETLVELDIEYGKLAQESGVPHYLRAPAVGVRPEFIGGLAALALESLNGMRRDRFCPTTCSRCFQGLGDEGFSS